MPSIESGGLTPRPMVESIYQDDPYYRDATPRGRRQRGVDGQGNPTEMVYYLHDTPTVGKNGTFELMQRALLHNQALNAEATALAEEA